MDSETHPKNQQKNNKPSNITNKHCSCPRHSRRWLKVCWWVWSCSWWKQRRCGKQKRQLMGPVAKSIIFWRRPTQGHLCIYPSFMISCNPKTLNNQSYVYKKTVRNQSGQEPVKSTQKSIKPTTPKSTKKISTPKKPSNQKQNIKKQTFPFVSPKLINKQTPFRFPLSPPSDLLRQGELHRSSRLQLLRPGVWLAGLWLGLGCCQIVFFCQKRKGVKSFVFSLFPKVNGDCFVFPKRAAGACNKRYRKLQAAFIALISLLVSPAGVSLRHPTTTWGRRSLACFQLGSLI